jgi:hypothetical protein
MKLWLRAVSGITLGAFLALAATEAFHVAREGHVDSHCAVCQIMHHAPAIGPGEFHFEIHGQYSALSLVVFIFGSAESIPEFRSRSPPIA